jgi:hypothetical protein
MSYRLAYSGSEGGDSDTTRSESRCRTRVG